MSINEIFTTIQKHADVLLTKNNLPKKNWSAIRMIHHAQLLANASDDGSKFTVDKSQGKLDPSPEGIKKVLDTLKVLIASDTLDKVKIRKNAVHLEALCALASDVLVRILRECRYPFIGVPPIDALEL